MAAADVGSCSSSASRFSRLAVAEQVEEDRGGAAACFLAGGFFVTGAVEVEGMGSRPENRSKWKL